MAESAQLAIATGATPTLITEPTDSTDKWAGDTLSIFNAGTVTVYLGGADVSTANGFRGLVAGSTLVVDIGTEGLYGVVSGGSAGAIDVLRVR